MMTVPSASRKCDIEFRTSQAFGERGGIPPILQYYDILQGVMIVVIGTNM